MVQKNNPKISTEDLNKNIFIKPNVENNAIIEKELKPLTIEQLLFLINKETSQNMYLTINGEYYRIDNIRAIENAFKSGYNKTITLKINGELKVLNGVLL